MGLLKRSSIDRHGYGRILIIFLISCRLLLLVIMNDFSPGESPQSVIRNLENDIEINMGNISDLSRTFSDLVLWSSDFHISPIADIKNVVAHYGVRVIDKSLSDHCRLSNTCQTDLRVINKQNGINLGGCPNSLKSSFYDSYINDEEMKTVSAFLCTHAASLCEVFMPFDRPMIVIASTRYEIGRHSSSRWLEWNQNLKLISQNPYNIVAANNRYDQEYIKYFTDIKEVHLLPNLCGYITARYNPTNKVILIAPARGVNTKISEQLKSGVISYKNKRKKVDKLKNPETFFTFSHIRDLYPKFEYTDIAQHPAIVVLPYQVSFMSLFEFYRMGIPLFVPSPALLTDWHIRYGVLNERTWATVFGIRNSSSIGKHENSTSTMTHDPNDEVSRVAVLQWISLSDFYIWPHISQFNSWEELFTLLENADLNDISAKMLSYNVIQEKEIREKWQFILGRVSDGKKYKGNTNSYDTSISLESDASDNTSKNTEHHISLNKDKNQNDEIATDMKNKNGENEYFENNINNLNENVNKINESDNENEAFEYLDGDTYRVRDALLHTYGVTLSNDCTGQTVSN